MKEYTFELIIKEGSDEFWDDIPSSESGVIEVERLVKDMLETFGFFTNDNCILKLRKFEDV